MLDSSNITPGFVGWILITLHQCLCLFNMFCVDGATQLFCKLWLKLLCEHSQSVANLILLHHVLTVVQFSNDAALASSKILIHGVNLKRNWSIMV